MDDNERRQISQSEDFDPASSAAELASENLFADVMADYGRPAAVRGRGPAAGVAEKSAVDDQVGRQTRDAKAVVHNPEAPPEAKTESPDNSAKTATTGETTFRFRGKNLVYSEQNGVGTYFKDERGQEWQSRDGSKWTRKGSDDTDNWYGQIKLDGDGNLVKVNSSYGRRTVYGADGSLTSSFTTAEGKDVTLKQDADGTRTLKNGDEVWRSQDGKSWTQGDRRWNGNVSVDKYGRLHSKAREGQWNLTEQSAQTKEIAERTEQIERNYNVRFGYPGEVVKVGNKDLPADLRMPTKEELDVIENTLEKFKHMVPEKDGKPDFGRLKLGFVSPDGNGRKVSEWGWYDSDPPRILFGPTNSTSAWGWSGTEGTALHELAHHLQQLRWQSNPEDTIPPDDVLNTFGFEAGPNGSYRLRDGNGDLWHQKTVKVKNPETGKKEEKDLWFPVVNGKVSRDQKLALSNSDLRARMAPEKITATAYFDYPAEAHAEAKAMYLMNPRQLHQINPTVYRKIQEWDQADINARYGNQKDQSGADILDENGKPMPAMMRGLDGKLVPFGSQALKQRSDAESAWTRETLLPYPKPREMTAHTHRGGCCTKGPKK